MSPSEEPQRGSPSISERIYDKLLSAYPEEFREDHGPQMTQAFGDLYREERHQGKLGFAKLWIKILPDLALSAIVERSRVVATHNPLPWRERISALDVAIAFVLSFFLIIIALAAFPFSSFVFEESLIGLTTIVLVASLATMLGVGLTISTKATRITTRSVGLRWVPVRWLFVGVALGIACWAIASSIGALYYQITGNILYTVREEFLSGLPSATFLELAFLWFSAGLFASFAYELLFRGILYTYLRRWGIGLAVFVSATIFGLVSFGFGVSLLAGIGVGAVLALLYERSGSLWPPVACAIAINTLGIFFGGLMF